MRLLWISCRQRSAIPVNSIRRCSVALDGRRRTRGLSAAAGAAAAMDPSARVSFRAKFAMEKIDIQKATELYASEVDAMPDIASKNRLKDILVRSAERSQEWLSKDLLNRLQNDSLEVRKRIGAVRTFRNYRFQSVPPVLIRIAGAANEPKCCASPAWKRWAGTRSRLRVNR